MTLDGFLPIRGADRPSLPEERLPLRDGQIVHGRILHLTSDGRALVFVAGRKWQARVDAALEVDKDYWFRVLAKEGEDLRLQIIPFSQGDRSLEKFLGLPATKEMKALLEAVKQWKMPAGKAFLLQAHLLLTSVSDLQAGISALMKLVTARLPLSKEVFRFVYEMERGTSFLKVLAELEKRLDSGRPEQLELSRTIRFFTKGEGFPSLDWTRAEDVERAFRLLFERMGWSRSPLPTLRDHIGALLHEDPADRNIFGFAETFLHSLLGAQQVFSEQDPMVRWSLFLPVPLPEGSVDFFIRWEGKKGKNGKLDGDYCRILFDLEFPHLGKVRAGMLVQKRVISLTVENGISGLEGIAKPFLPLLKDHLSEIGYELGLIRFTTPPAPSDPGHLPKHPQSAPKRGGIDIKV